MADQLKQIMKMNKVDLAKAARKSVYWFEEQATKLFDLEEANEMNLLERSNKRDLHSSLRPGNMYFYAYEAKWAKQLPYYDMFPLCLPFAPTNNGFIGLNLHYLPYDYRIKLLDKLSDFQSSNTLDNKTKIMFSWNLIKGVSRYRAAEPCVKRYLWSQVRSEFRIIRPEDWATAALLPFERFVGSDKFQVWADSLAKM